MNPDAIPTTPKPKRTRKPTTPRTRKPKDTGILAIEQAAAKQKDDYRKAQASQGILTRITEKLLPRLTEAHRRRLYDALSKMETPRLPAADGNSAS